MANIVLSGLYSQFQREFNTVGQDSTRFKQDFIDAVNYSTQMMNVLADLETRISSASNTDDTIALDQKYTYVLQIGIRLQLMQMGRRPPKDSNAMVGSLEDRFRNAISMMATDLINARQDADPDDESDSIVGLGYLG